MKKEQYTVELSSKERIKAISLANLYKKITLTVSREKCNDILLELIDINGNAKGKPLNKSLPEIKNTRNIQSLRFIMNNFSNAPISINVTGVK